MEKISKPEKIQKKLKNSIQIVALIILSLFIFMLTFYKGITPQEYLAFACVSIYLLFFLKRLDGFHIRLIGGLFTFIYSLLSRQAIVNKIALILLALMIVILIIGMVLRWKTGIKFNIFDLSVGVTFVTLFLILLMGSLLLKNVNNINYLKIITDNSYLYLLPLFYFVSLITIGAVQEKIEAKKWIVTCIVVVTILVGLRFAQALFH